MTGDPVRDVIEATVRAQERLSADDEQRLADALRRGRGKRGEGSDA